MLDWKKFLFFLVVGLLATSIKAENDNDDDSSDEGEVEGAASTEPERENGVYVLTDQNFDDFVEDKDVVLLEFYAPWCGHCKSFAPTYEKIAEELEGKVAVAKIDATEQKDLGQRFEVQGYPTIKILKDGTAIKYEGARSQEAVVAKVMELSDPNWKPPPAAVLVLTDSNFDETVENADIILVEFYAPWCGHCKKLEPEYESAAQELSKLTPPVPLAKVDATVEKEVAGKYDISGYPTLKLFRRGRAYDYDGGRDTRGIVSYMIEQSKPPSTVVDKVKKMRDLLHHASDVTIIGCFKDEEDSALLLYQEAGNSLRADFEFHHTFDEAVIKDLGAKQGEVIVFHPERFQSKYEDKRYNMMLTDDVDKAALTEFYNSHAVPLVGQRTRDNMKKRYSKYPLIVVYYGVDFSFDYRVATQLWRTKVLGVANEMKDVNFAIANEEDFGEELKRVGLDDSPEEINVIAYDDKDRRYPMEPNDEFDSEVLKEFVDDFLAGKIAPKIKSAPKPKKNKGPVKVIVGDTFDELVTNSKENVLIEFYAPWCGHCKKLEPIYKKLGKKFKDNADVVIAKMDATANDIPNSNYEAEGFPTLYWAPAGSKNQPLKYDGGRELDDLVKYINEKLKSTKDEL